MGKYNPEREFGLHNPDRSGERTSSGTFVDWDGNVCQIPDEKVRLPQQRYSSVYGNSRAH